MKQYLREDKKVYSLARGMSANRQTEFLYILEEIQRLKNKHTIGDQVLYNHYSPVSSGIKIVVMLLEIVITAKPEDFESLCRFG
jgi:hypothetical protein